MSGAGRRALVTGGAVRVGRSITLALAGAGYHVAVHYHASRERAEVTVREARELGPEALSIAADLTRPEEAASLVEHAAGALGGLDLLVNSAAVFPRARPEDVSLEAWDRVFALNARAVFLCSREASARMVEGASIVNIADVAAFEGWPSYAPYAATKAAVVSLTRSLAAAWAPRIRVNAVAPGPVLLPEQTDAAERRRAASSTALGRIGSPEDVAGAVLYLDRAEFVTGEVLRVEGGQRLRRGRED